MINLLNDSYWKQTHATCTAQHADDWKCDRETGQRIDHNIVRKYHDASATTPVHARRRKINKGQATYPEETSHNSIGHGIQVTTINTHLWLLSRRFCLHHHSWPMLCTHRTTQEQSNRIDTWRAWLEYTIEFNTHPHPCEYTFEFSTGIGLYCLSSYALGVCVNMSAKFYALTCLPSSVFSVSSSLSHLPQQSSLEATRFSNLCASCVQHLVYGRMRVPRCCPLWFQFHSVPSQQTSALFATTVLPWCLPTLPSPLLHNCSMPLKPDPDCEHAISCLLPWSPHHSCFSVSLDHSPSQSLCRLLIVWSTVLFCHCCHALQTQLTCLPCPWTYLKSRFNCLISKAVGLFNFVHNNRTVLWMSVLSLLRYNRVSTEDLNLDACSSLNSSLSPSMHDLSNFWRNTPLAIAHLQLFQRWLQMFLVRDARQFLPVTHFQVSSTRNCHTWFLAHISQSSQR